MHRTGICLFFAVGLTACSSGGSDSTATSDSTGGGTTTVGGTTTIGDTDAGTAVDGGTTTVAVGGTTDSGTGDGGGTAGGSAFGLFSVDSYDDEVLFDGVFLSLPNPISNTELTSALIPTTDECEIFDFSSIGGDTTDIDLIAGQIPTSLSAGDVLTVGSPAGTYFELPKIEFGEFVVYTNDDDSALAGPAPAGLVLNIPGDEFPAFTNAAIPNAVPLQMTSPSLGAQITADTTYTWTPSSTQNTFIDISAVGVGGSSSLSVDCTAIDDGSFTFPAAIKAELDGFTGVGGDEARISLNIVQQNNAVLYLSSSIERTN